MKVIQFVRDGWRKHRGRDERLVDGKVMGSVEPYSDAWLWQVDVRAYQAHDITASREEAIAAVERLLRVARV